MIKLNDTELEYIKQAHNCKRISKKLLNINTFKAEENIKYLLDNKKRELEYSKEFRDNFSKNSVVVNSNGLTQSLYKKENYKSGDIKAKIIDEQVSLKMALLDYLYDHSLLFITITSDNQLNRLNGSLVEQIKEQFETLDNFMWELKKNLNYSIKMISAVEITKQYNFHTHNIVLVPDNKIESYIDSLNKKRMNTPGIGRTEIAIKHIPNKYKIQPEKNKKIVCLNEDKQIDSIINYEEIEDMDKLIEDCSNIIRPQFTPLNLKSFIIGGTKKSAGNYCYFITTDRELEDHKTVNYLTKYITKEESDDNIWAKIAVEGINLHKEYINSLDINTGRRSKKKFDLDKLSIKEYTKDEDLSQYYIDLENTKSYNFKYSDNMFYTDRIKLNKVYGFFRYVLLKQFKDFKNNKLERDRIINQVYNFKTQEDRTNYELDMYLNDNIDPEIDSLVNDITTTIIQHIEDPYISDNGYITGIKYLTDSFIYNGDITLNRNEMIIFGETFNLNKKNTIRDKRPEFKELIKQIKNKLFLDPYILMSLYSIEDKNTEVLDLIEHFKNLKSGNIYSITGNDKYLLKYKNRYYTHYHYNGIVKMLDIINKLNYKKNIVRYQDNSLLTVEQNAAVKCSLENNFSCITGGAGTGKTYTAKYLLDNLKGQTLILATTGTAAAKLGKELGIKGTTIHSAIGKGITGISTKLLDNIDNIIVDESSMLDFETCLELLKVLPDNCNITFLGDKNQLPPVSLGFMFKEFVSLAPTISLNITHRQKCSKLIKQINMLEKIDFDITPDLDADIILAFKNKTVNKINKSKQKLNNNDFVSKYFKIGDPIMFLKNDRDKIRRNNGDKGIVIDKDTVQFEDGMIVKIPGFKNCCLAYSITIHKSQGQQWENVHVIIDDTEHITKSLLYVGFSRCQKKLSISGSEETYNDIYNSKMVSLPLVEIFDVLDI